MADVDMPDAGPAAPAKLKANTKVTKGGAAETAADARKRFEVKKACLAIPTSPKHQWLTIASGTPLLCGLGISWLTIAPSVEITSWIFVSHQISLLSRSH
jgi:hypothetical protein